MNNKKIVPYLYILPTVILMFIFVYLPIFRNFQFSFYRMSSFSTTRTFIGLDNYRRLIEDPVIWIALKNNTYYAIISLIFQVGIGLVIALLLESKYVGRLRGFFRATFFIPSVISITVVSVLWWFIYKPNVGLLNSGLSMIGLENLAHPWLGKSSTAIFSVIAMSQWHYTGYIAMLLIIAIQKVPKELYEAAEIDGASGLQKTLRVTLPLIKGMLVVASVITIIGAFKVFNEVQVMTQGGPHDSSQVLGTYMNQAAWLHDETGYAAAIGVLMFIITFVASIIQIKLNKIEVGDDD